jgi:AcrR family transcriptional regulator
VTGTKVEAAGPAARREEILEAATRLFAERGFSQADTQALAEALQVGKGTLYRYFPSKRELFLAAVDRVLERLGVCTETAVKGVTDPFERIVRAIRAYLGFFDEHPEFVELLIQERALFKDNATPRYFAYRHQNVERWRQLYRALIAEGRVRDMPVERITDVVSNLIYGTMIANYFAGRNRSAEEQAQDILDVVLRGILSEAERDRTPARP